ncbi:MAG: hypothetical protein QOJ42_7664 [Acidobacteriaceae bacterium]|nr:hypothetical protein [Acidobacteriaceae bacterium]
MDKNGFATAMQDFQEQIRRAPLEDLCDVQLVWHIVDDNGNALPPKCEPISPTISIGLGTHEQSQAFANEMFLDTLCNHVREAFRHLAKDDSDTPTLQWADWPDEGGGLHTKAPAWRSARIVNVTLHIGK